MPVTPLMLKKQPDIVTTIRKLRKYIGPQTEPSDPKVTFSWQILCTGFVNNPPSAALTFASIFRFIVLIGIIGCWRMEEQFRKNSVKGWCCISQNTSLFYSSRGRLILGCFWKSGSWVSRCYKRPRSKPSFAYGSWSNDKGFTQISNINKSQPIPLVISIIKLYIVLNPLWYSVNISLIFGLMTYFEIWQSWLYLLRKK